MELVITVALLFLRRLNVRSLRDKKQTSVWIWTVEL